MKQYGPWNRCMDCGRFISYYDFQVGNARHELLYPESAYTYETWLTYHVNCKPQPSTDINSPEYESSQHG